MEAHMTIMAAMGKQIMWHHFSITCIMIASSSWLRSQVQAKFAPLLKTTML